MESPVDVGEVVGRSLAIFLKAGEDGYLIFGTARLDGGELVLERGDGSYFRIPSETTDRLRRIDEDPDGLFEGAEFLMDLVVVPVPEGVDAETLEPTGLNLNDLR